MASSATSGSSFGLVNGRPVFLDLLTDSYFMLPPDEEESFLSAIRAGDLDTPEAADCPRPTRAVIDHEPASQFSLQDLFACWRFLRAARRDLARRELAAALALAQRPRPSRASQEVAVALAKRFCAARRWLPLEPRCLTDSLALLAFLRSHEAGANLVFGARLDPFAAHCWLQSGTVLLNDRLDRVETFTPVCIVGS